MRQSVEILTAFLGAFGFSMLYNIKGKKLWVASAGGLLCWSVYLLLGIWLDDKIAQYFIAAFIVTVYAEICARIMKTPTTTFLIPGMIPLVPGGSLYYTMSYAVNGMWDQFAGSGINTVGLSAAMAAGIMAASSIIRISTALSNNRKMRIKSKMPPSYSAAVENKASADGSLNQ